MPRQSAPEKNGFLRLQHRMARKNAIPQSTKTASVRFTLTISGQHARLILRDHEIDEKGVRLMRQVIDSAARRGVQNMELDLRGLRTSAQGIDGVVASTRTMLRPHIEMVVLRPEPVTSPAIEMFASPKFDPSLVAYPGTEDGTTPTLEAVA